MGVEISTAKFIASSYETRSYEEVVTLGRQNLLMDTQLKKLLEKIWQKNGHQDLGHKADSTYADQLFRLLGTKEVHSIDFSNYEGATILHDMNQAIPEHLKNQYDLLFDGGTLEHIFNFPVALKNCLEMVKVGGRIIICTPANNMCGHGFYQFSPELFFRVFSDVNGFKIVRIVAVDMETGKWFNVIDPERVRSRVELVNFHSVSLYVEAEKIAIKDVFKQVPQQSDYVVSWMESLPLAEKLREVNLKRNQIEFRNTMKKSFPLFYDMAKLIFKRKNNLKDTRYYSPAKDHIKFLDIS